MDKWVLLAGGGLDPGCEVSDLVIETAALTYERANLAISVHNGRVITPTEGLPNLGQGEVGEFAAEVHSDLARGDQHA